MKKLMTGASAAVLGALALTGTAMAADAYKPIMSTNTVVFEDPGFVWEGMYYGFEKGIWLDDSFQFNGVVGTNFMLGDNVLAGLEGNLGFLTDFSDYVIFGEVDGRLGVLISNDAQIYGVGSLGYLNSDTYYGVGGGIQFAASDNMSIRLEAQGLGELGSSISETRVTAGFLWHAN
ncbi:outer membrane protein [Cucumibacter marinus]|uniref:outer membrane protein n=1 Tax=Cucumibacter marinus TaxID=1121252 RepID=UPI000426AAAB|nr:hypothetical protein [Cucumibacter marinus]